MPADSFASESEAANWLCSAEAIRARCNALLARAEAGESAHFVLAADRIDAAADFTVDTIRASYPDLEVPYHSRWRHFEAGGVDRWARLSERLADLDATARARTRVDLAVVSVLLDAGAGASWRYREPGTGAVLGRSEGLALASLALFAEGAFSSDPAQPLRVDADGLEGLNTAVLARGFQVGDHNPLVGIEGRVELLNRLASAMRAAPALFGDDASPRIGGLVDHLAQCAGAGRLDAEHILDAVLRGLGPIWPGRIRLGGRPLGDVWRHTALACDDASSELVPFHKLSQWLSYSLIEPMEDTGLVVAGQDRLTGLAEYRNGGLLVDLGVLHARDPDLLERPQPVSAEAIVEWRALTVALLDRLADRIRHLLGYDAGSLPLVKVLEGGTWSAGRRAAAERRAGGEPPIRVISDGTVF